MGGGFRARPTSHFLGHASRGPGMGLAEEFCGCTIYLFLQFPALGFPEFFLGGETSCTKIASIFFSIFVNDFVTPVGNLGKNWKGGNFPILSRDFLCFVPQKNHKNHHKNGILPKAQKSQKSRKSTKVIFSDDDFFS